MVRRSATLCLVMLLSILSMALAPLSGSAGTLHVICGTGGPQTILLNAQGEPIDPADRCDCPSCICSASSSAAPAAPGTWSAPETGLRRAATDHEIAQTRPQPGYARPVARGPPAEKVRNHV
ncbi:MAG TPA: hypothetical protein PLI13_02865 [Paracoccus sp. (in: a-proteobacteria)]|nr:hypothetical protein [Paracoccus sp. (in: a-proteobacteria)]